MRETVQPNGKVLREWLKSNCYSNKDFSHKTMQKSKGITVLTINNFLNEKRPTTRTTVRIISMATGIPISSLIKDHE